MFISSCIYLLIIFITEKYLDSKVSNFFFILTSLLFPVVLFFPVLSQGILINWNGFEFITSFIIFTFGIYRLYLTLDDGESHLKNPILTILLLTILLINSLEFRLVVVFLFSFYNFKLTTGKNSYLNTKLFCVLAAGLILRHQVELVTTLCLIGVFIAYIFSNNKSKSKLLDSYILLALLYCSNKYFIVDQSMSWLAIIYILLLSYPIIKSVPFYLSTKDEIRLNLIMKKSKLLEKILIKRNVSKTDGIKLLFKEYFLDLKLKDPKEEFYEHRSDYEYGIILLLFLSLLGMVIL